MACARCHHRLIGHLATATSVLQRQPRSHILFQRQRHLATAPAIRHPPVAPAVAVHDDPIPFSGIEAGSVRMQEPSNSDGSNAAKIAPVAAVSHDGEWHAEVDILPPTRVTKGEATSSDGLSGDVAAEHGAAQLASNPTPPAEKTTRDLPSDEQLGEVAGQVADSASQEPSEVQGRKNNSGPRPTSRSLKQLLKNKISSKGKDRVVNPRKRENWQIQKAALQRKFGEESWQPRKRLSPDTMECIRALHASDPVAYSTEVIAKNFEITPDAIRRTLKSKWRPNEREAEDRRVRWEKRGVRKWQEMSDVGMRPPAKWRALGVTSPQTTEKGKPIWKKVMTEPLKTDV